MFCSGRELSIVTLLLFLTGCGSSPDRIPDELVFVPFDYLGGSAEAQWTGRATSVVAAAQTSSLSASGVRDALANRGRHVVEGYVTGQPGSLLAVATLRDELNQTTLRTFKARGANVLEVASSLAAQIIPKPVPYTSSSPEAVRALFAGNPEAALALDPKYGSAHLAHIEGLLRARNVEEAKSAMATAHHANLSTLEAARLKALGAETARQRSDALLQAARAARFDLELWRGAAEGAMASKDHAGAVEAYQKAAVSDPENIAIWNTLAYAQAFGGDLEEAKRSIEQYRKLQPRDANAFDSMGEIYFYEGRFREAEQEFLRAFEMDNSRLGGGEAYRAALSAFLAGDKAKAEAHFARYVGFRKQRKDELAGLRESIWYYSTGRAAEARQKASGLGFPAAKSQVAIWDAVDGKGASAFGERPEFAGWKLLSTGRYAEAVEYWKKVYDGTSLILGNEARVLLAAALQGANRGAEAQALLAKWPLPPMGAEPGFSSAVFAKAMEMKAARR